MVQTLLENHVIIRTQCDIHEAGCAFAGVYNHLTKVLPPEPPECNTKEGLSSAVPGLCALCRRGKTLCAEVNRSLEKG